MEEIKATNFIEEFINEDLAQGKADEVITRDRKSVVRERVSASV